MTYFGSRFINNCLGLRLSVHNLNLIKEKFGSKIYSKIAFQQFLLNHYLFTIKVDESKLLKPFIRGWVRYLFGYSNPRTKPFLWKTLVKLKKRRARGSIMFKEQTKKSYAWLQAWDRVLSVPDTSVLKRWGLTEPHLVWAYHLNVSYFQKDFLVSSFGPKNQRNFLKDFCPSF